MGRRVAPFVLGTLFALAAGCSPGESAGFHLPPGDVAAGKAAFRSLGCIECHSVLGETDLPAPTAPTRMELGGKLYRVTTYGQLVTSIIHPSHSISDRAPQEVRTAGSTTMRNFNDSMTVTQLIDLVSFLHSKYSKLEPEYNPVPF